MSVWDETILGFGIIGMAYVGVKTLKIGKKVVSRNKEHTHKVGSIYLSGPVISYEGRSSFLQKTEDIMFEDVEDSVEEALEDKVDALIINLDSPGGNPVTSKEIAEYLNGLEIPTVALVHSYAASGGYYIAAGCDKIVAQDSSIVGSIGVIAGMINYEELASTLGIKYESFKAGEHKDFGNPFRKMTSEEREMFQGEMNELHSIFINDVARLRGVEREAIEPYATGRIFLGNKAKEVGLIDEVGGLDKALEVISTDHTFTRDDIKEYSGSGGGFISRILESPSYNIGRGIAKETIRAIARPQIKF